MQEPLKLAVLASGNGSNFVALCDAEIAGELPKCRISLLICNKPEVQVLNHAKIYKIPFRCIPHQSFSSREEFDEEMLKELNNHDIDLIVLAGFMRILTPKFIRSFPNRIINVHPSLLPAFPGKDAIGDALKYGVKVTGVTVHFVDEGVDSGPIILQEAVKVSNDETTESLRAKIQQIEHRLLPKAVGLFAKGCLSKDGRKVQIKEG